MWMRIHTEIEVVRSSGHLRDALIYYAVDRTHLINDLVDSISKIRLSLRI
jgi:hypothetical protein